MAGSRRGRRLHQRARPHRPDESSPPPQEPATPREVAVAERPSKKASVSTSSAMYGPKVWADLLECLLHQIIALLSSVHDLLAFRSTCRDWRAAFFSFPSPFSSSIPPLLLQPRTRYPHRNHSRRAVDSLLYNCEWQVIDPVKKTSSCIRSPTINPPKGMRYLGCSYGNLIFSNGEHCLLVDIFGGTVVRPPKLKSTDDHYRIYCGTLAAPLDSPNSCLLLFSNSSIFQWEVGSDCWLHHSIGSTEINGIMVFKGEIFAMDLECLHTIRLAPQLNVHEVEIDWDDYYTVAQISDTAEKTHVTDWLVACGDMLLMVVLFRCCKPHRDFYGILEVYRLDFSMEPELSGLR